MPINQLLASYSNNKLEYKNIPIQSIGIYVPANLHSTLLMNAIPAKIAGCSDIVCATPPTKTGDIDPAFLYTAKLCGINNVFAMGGAQAIAALAYGTESIPRVDKIVGPGNIYVATAKSKVFGQVGIMVPVRLVCHARSPAIQIRRLMVLYVFRGSRTPIASTIFSRMRCIRGLHLYCFKYFESITFVFEPCSGAWT